MIGPMHAVLRRLALLAIVTLVAAACMSSLDVIAEKSWTLASVNGAAPAAPGGITFHANGSFELQTGCNSAGGTFEVQGNRLKLGPLQTTLMLCEGAVGAQETAVLGAFTDAIVFAIDTGTGQLRLTGTNGSVLLFNQPAG